MKSHKESKEAESQVKVAQKVRPIDLGKIALIVGIFVGLFTVLTYFFAPIVSLIITSAIMILGAYFIFIYKYKLTISSILIALCFAILEKLLFPQFLGDVSKLNFEKGNMGWIPQTHIENLGVTNVKRSEKGKALKGNYSLEVTVNLVGSDSNRRKGETWVNLRNSPPKGEKFPASLTGKDISCWILIEDKDAIGVPNHENGIQLFVKDNHWRAEYSTWEGITPDRIGKWFEIELKPSRKAPKDGFTSENFNPDSIMALGVKIALNDSADLNQSFNGIFWVDAINW